MPSRRSKPAEQQTESYAYTSASRKNLPTEQTEPLMGPDDKRPLPFTPEIREFDDQPRLAWARSPRLDEDGNLKPYEAHPLYAREKIEPYRFIKQLQAAGDDRQGGMFEAFNGLPEGSALGWYQYDGHWQNRLIHGESARVMASLAGRENLAGQVQMIYFDPPYGMSCKSNFQVAVDDLGTSENRKGLPSDPQTIAAFRDTYEHGVHSYLDGMLERLALCRDLLAESGSIFVQIGDENVLRMGLLLDEVFGAENRVSLIPYATSGNSSANALSSVADFLLWYAKGKGQLKYRQLYEPLDRAGKLAHMSWHAMVEEEDGTARSLTAEEMADPDANLPPGTRMYSRMPLVSPGASTTGRSEPYHWRGQDWQCPPGEHWRVSMDGLDRLATLGRLDAAGQGSLLRWKRYEDEVPGRGIHNLWHRKMAATGKYYVVQTANSVIERCLLMATDPGDLVLDPTCGGATTAYSAERWGRRWVTIDTSPVGDRDRTTAHCHGDFPLLHAQRFARGRESGSRTLRARRDRGTSRRLWERPGRGLRVSARPVCQCGDARLRPGPAGDHACRPTARHARRRACCLAVHRRERDAVVLPPVRGSRGCRRRRDCPVNSCGRRRLRGNCTRAHLRVADPRRPAGQRHPRHRCRAVDRSEQARLAPGHLYRRRQRR